MAESALVAIGIVILPPPDVSRLAVDLSASLPAAESQGLRLGPVLLPHISIAQQFVRRTDLDAALDAVQFVVIGRDPLHLTISGGVKGSSAVWMMLERAPALADLHAGVMNVLQPFERSDGTGAAFAGGDGRPGDVAWVGGYRHTASGNSFTPHITLGHAAEPPRIEPRQFDATTVAACQLGRFCSCREILCSWTLD